MKKILSFAAICFITLTATAQEFKFEEETIDYGKIALGSEGKRVFEFTNIGDAPLIISDVKSTCGCTVPSKPEAPIMPGEKGKIEVSYDTKRLGGFSKAITIMSNAKGQERKMVKIKGYISKDITPKKEKSMTSSQS
ncbi:DUF1573 domain-containing protein [Tenacibaculum maritimum]|uniref:DUF1573 domain-containing protein n=1 Tax=Tenacibaculum maritimum TaxID=107401 RepID=UPI0010A4F636|nr:DUF1573 domain-containing protein [Tenacibaculum maritimum]MCD9564086.1 DUF1573 domain-containing protein [Tenacibaculum maritimum]MCD9564722.1 DUF1573 domain-containing protein [Tenacibaculum maritimum]MCD9577851.1 DUF1573 domain-containing protein [Tenacibaculum maritimum]MCD9581946.1 DUF1573 domain-containing protein [Tenacibaculum maritimum]MCD9585716.1 DUF1573 domain-containing protein [Tenacibaculum maritimum]